MTIVTGDRYLEKLVKFVEAEAGPLIEGSLVLKLNPVGLHYVYSRLESLSELEGLLAGAPVDYLRAYVSDLGDYRALEQLRRILRLLTSLKVVSVLPQPARDPTPLSLLPFGRLRVLELRGCDLSTSAARGLLELRHTLEKIICHNSTDALRHVFASRIVDIKDSPHWNRLSFVSCACNDLVLMDESLQLLSAVETLDLSRNKFAKVDNLRKCTKLKHLDLGFNQLRTIAQFSEVCAHIVKLVLRNNALTTLHGIENLKLLEGLDVSYNIISNLSELEILSGLPAVKNLWLEGNPLCCALWYRAQVFSFLNHPDKLKLDEKEISTREFWQMQIIVASRQKRPSSFGFYAPAKEDAEEGGIDRKRKKVCRLASIQSEAESTYICSDQESISCDIEIQGREENVVSENEVEIFDLIKEVELMKKERSALWLHEFREWLEEASDDFVTRNTQTRMALHTGNDIMKDHRRQRYLGESSRLVSDTVKISGEESITKMLESGTSFSDISTCLKAHKYINQIRSLRNDGGTSLFDMTGMDLRYGHVKSDLYEGISREGVLADKTYPNTLTVQDSGIIINNVGKPSVDGGSEFQSSSTLPGSPPHYQKDILHRRHNLVEEILQLSADSYSMASSDSNTSCSEDDFSELGPSDIVDQSVKNHFSYKTVHALSPKSLSEDRNFEQAYGIPLVRKNGKCSLGFHSEQASNDPKASRSENFEYFPEHFPLGPQDDEITHFNPQKGNCFGKRKGKLKPKRRIIPLEGEDTMDRKPEISQKPNNNTGVGGYDVQDVHRKETNDMIQEDTDKNQTLKNSVMSLLVGDDIDRILLGVSCSSKGADSMFENYFNTNVADSSICETCWHYVRCGCILEQESRIREREVVLVLSSEKKLYVLLVSVAVDNSGCFMSLLGCHMVEDIKEVLVGLGLQVVRIYIEMGAAYLFLTRNIQKSRELLHTLEAFDHSTSNKYSIRRFRWIYLKDKYVGVQK